MVELKPPETLEAWDEYPLPVGPMKVELLPAKYGGRDEDPPLPLEVIEGYTPVPVPVGPLEVEFPAGYGGRDEEKPPLTDDGLSVTVGKTVPLPVG